MKRLKTILLFLIICISCFGQNRTRTNTTNTSNNTNNQRVICWEYRVVSNYSNNYYRDDVKSSPAFKDPERMLNEMGKEGWELVSTYTEIATAFPNFGNSDSVLGICSNTRTIIVNFVFKRPKSGK